VITTKKSQPVGGSASAPFGKGASGKFWIRNANRKLNRTGDFILKNLRAIRQEAPSRARSA
jgi:hypothetical protein